MPEVRYCGCYVNHANGTLKWDEGNESIRCQMPLAPEENEFCGNCLGSNCDAVKKRFQARGLDG